MGISFVRSADMQPAKILKYGLVLLLQFLMTPFMLVTLVAGQVFVWFDAVIIWLEE